MTTTAPALPSICVTELNRLEERRALIMQAAPHALVAEHVVAEWSDRFAVIKAHVSDHGDAWIDVWIRSMDDVIDLRRHLADLGYHLEKHGGVQEYPEEKRTVYNLAALGLPGDLILHVRAADEPGATCRYVECGEKVVKTYRLECAP